MTGFIDEGLPASRADWPQGVLDALSSFTQGMVVPSPIFVYHGDPKAPVHTITKIYSEAGHGDPLPMQVTGKYAPRWAVVTSGTCDVGEEGTSRLPLRPMVQVSPVVNMEDQDPSRKKQIQDGKIAYLVHLPALSDHERGFWVADLRIEYPVEKGWLASQAPVLGFHTEVDQQKIGLAVGHLRQRPAMGDRYYELIHGPIADRLTALYKNDRSLADRLDLEIQEWGVKVDSRLDPSRVEIVLLSNNEEPAEEVATWWRATVDSLRESAMDAGLVVIGPRFNRLDTISVAEYRTLTILPSPSRRFSAT